MKEPEMFVVKLYPTHNLAPRLQEVCELYSLNKHHGHLSCWRALWLALKRQVVVHTCKLMVIDNLGLKVDLDAAYEEHSLQLGTD